ncbi:PaaI family thioesterase [Roseospirillum parvum]|uniref:Uncharacterized domain 1-containing protein n=1 Tax=Roseospirillum parvum TaxID=83401 RepID=A0A1G8EJP7_9PROT|nr:PaaI family thioesterase [Roseospirillum parvum]SDH70163.1 uncharacterized domain 1-containing protein [Roseospirillum parvum]
MLERIRTLKAEGRFPEVCALFPYAGFLGIEVAVEGDTLTTRLPFKADNVGNTSLPALHGGVVGGLLEHAAIMELLWRLDPTVPPRIINLSVDYLRPCRAVTTLARAEMVKQGRRIANIRVSAWQDGPDRPVAAAHCHFMLD